MPPSEKDTLRTSTKLLIGVALLLTILGLLFIYSSSSVYALEKHSSSFYFLKKQTIFFSISCISFVVCALIPLNVWYEITPFLFGACFALTMLATFSPFSMHIHGSSRWLSFAGYGIQPSEFLKFSLLMYIGYFLKRNQRLSQSLIKSYLPLACLLGISSFLLLKQPDFGSIVTILSTSLIIFFVAEFNLRHLIIGSLAAIPLGVVLIYNKAYRLHRITVFLDPWSDRLGKGFQIVQSLIAIAAGNVSGLGIGHSRQKYFYLPMQHTDFIFSIIAEETGFIGSCLLIILYALFCYLGIRIINQLQNDFAFFTNLGFITLIIVQTTINLMVTTGLLPTKGLGLPFVSYGGSSLLVCFSMLGFLVSSVRHER